MKRKLIISLLLQIAVFYAVGQLRPEVITEIKKRLQGKLTDSSRLSIYMELSQGYRFSNIDSALHYTDKAIDLSREINAVGAEGDALSQKGFILLETGELPQSLQYQFMALALSDKVSSPETEAFALNRIGNIYMEFGDFQKAIDYYRLTIPIFERISKTGYVHNEYSNIGNVYEKMGMLDSAKYYQQKVYHYSLTNTDRYAITYGEMRERLGNVERRLGNYDSAIIHYKKGIEEAEKDVDMRNVASIHLQLAKLFDTLGGYDSSFLYAKKTVDIAGGISWKRAIYEASGILSHLFKLWHQPDSALAYADLSAAIKDSLFGPGKFRQLQLITLGEQQRRQQLQEDQIKLRNNYRSIALLSALGVFLLIAIILWRNNRREHRTNMLLLEQKEQITIQRNRLEIAISDLKAAQSQLIQSEKMASLGELTAGIAHEIQNPLNFVNNFSDLNKELVDELQQELQAGKTGQAFAISNDIKENEEKINHHGKRADAIVKGMLQHSRSSTGQKEPTDINALADEYLRLAYHGLGGKDKDFNVIPIAIGMKTEFDQSIGKINIIPQDIGRVLLNLYNNAFYAARTAPLSAKGGFPDSDKIDSPTVWVSTKKVGDKVLISVRDNGAGIPQNIIDKIFQPFFTTKPTGQGTGLGLSLSYDIVKAHGGELKVETKEARPDDPVGRSEGSTFIIQLPIT